jgi:uncharacterized membrane protein (DUF2068 family)
VAETELKPGQGANRRWSELLWADMHRRIEDRGFVIWYLIIERGVKGLVLVAAAIFIYTHVRSGLDPFVSELIDALNLDAGRGFFRGLVFDALEKVAGLGSGTLVALATGALIYGLIEAAESVGLILRRRWAEYLVVLATAFFIPLEVREVILRQSPVRITSLLINIAIVAYLVRQKRLFQLDEPAATTAAPADSARETPD